MQRDWLIYSREHNKWWTSGERGYSSTIDEAGRYTRERAIQICKSANIARPADDPHEVMVPAPEAYEKMLAAVNRFCNGNRDTPIDERTLATMLYDAQKNWDLKRGKTPPNFEHLHPQDQEMMRHMASHLARWVVIGDATRLSAEVWPSDQDGDSEREDDRAESS